MERLLAMSFHDSYCVISYSIDIFRFTPQWNALARKPAVDVRRNEAHSTPDADHRHVTALDQTRNRSRRHPQELGEVADCQKRASTALAIPRTIGVGVVRVHVTSPSQSGGLLPRSTGSTAKRCTSRG